MIATLLNHFRQTGCTNSDKLSNINPHCSTKYYLDTLPLIRPTCDFEQLAYITGIRNTTSP